MARQLSPIDPFGYYYDGLTSTAYLAAENYEQALELANRSLDGNDRHLSTMRAKITALHFLGRGDDARAAAEDMMRRAPDFNLDEYASRHPAAQHGSGKRVVTALSAAGVQ